MQLCNLPAHSVPSHRSQLGVRISLKTSGISTKFGKHRKAGAGGTLPTEN